MNDYICSSALSLRRPELWSESLNNRRTTALPAQPTASPSEETLPQRSMHDSYAQIDLPLASSPALFEQYTNARGGIRTGKLMEHLDSLAGSAAYKHVLGPEASTLQGGVKERGFYIVTAAVDRLLPRSPEIPLSSFFFV
jgi:acyl-coenzyme A thioesterase 9